MAANLKNISLTAAKVYIAPRGEIAEVKKDLSNAKEIITACDKLITDSKAKRMGSVIDVKLTVGKGNDIEVKTDDNGLLLRANTPEAKIAGNWYEVFDFEVIKQFLNIKVVDVAKSGQEKAYTIAGQKIAPSLIPECVVILEGLENDSNEKVFVYLTNSGFTGELVYSFVDYVRAGNVENTPFEFSANSGGARLIKKEKAE